MALDQLVVELIRPMPTGRFDFDSRVIDSDDVVHVLNPRNRLLALCGRIWDAPWWQESWEAVNYPRCERCHAVRAAAVAARDTASDDAVWKEPAWRVLDGGDDLGRVHLLNPAAATQSLCGRTSVRIVAQGSSWISGDPCDTCDRVRAAGLGARPYAKAPTEPSPSGTSRKLRGQSPAAAGRSAKGQEEEEAARRARRAQTMAQRPPGSRRERAERERERTKKLRAAARTDRASSRSQRGTSVRTISGGLPTLGRRR
ncbi:hypothetical protein GCM10027517_11970 [Phycicoccus ginsengisoli]